MEDPASKSRTKLPLQDVSTNIPVQNAAESSLGRPKRHSSTPLPSRVPKPSTPISAARRTRVNLSSQGNPVPNHGRAAQSIGPEIRVRGSVRPSAIPRRIRTAQSIGHNAYPRMGSPSPQPRQPRRDNWMGTFQSLSARDPRPSLAFPNENTVVMQAMPGAYPSDDLVSASARSTVQRSYQSPDNPSNVSLGRSSHAEATFIPQRSSSRATLQSNRSYQSSRPNSPFTTISAPSIFHSHSIGGSAARRGRQPSPSASFVRRRSGYPGRMVSYRPVFPRRTQQNNGQVFIYNSADQIPTEHLIVHTRRRANVDSSSSPLTYPDNSSSVAPDVAPRYYDYSEGFEDHHQYIHPALESTFNSDNQPVIFEDEPLATGHSKTNYRFQEPTERIEQHVEDPSNQQTEQTTPKAHIPDNSHKVPYENEIENVEDHRSRLSRASLIPAQLNVSNKPNSIQPRPPTIRRRNTVSNESLDSIKFGLYDKDQSRDDLSLIASLYASSSRFADPESSSNGRVTSTLTTTNRSSFASLSRRLSATLSWYYQVGRQDSPETVPTSADTENFSSSIGRRSRMPARSSGYIVLSDSDGEESSNNVSKQPDTASSRKARFPEFPAEETFHTATSRQFPTRRGVQASHESVKAASEGSDSSEKSLNKISVLQDSVVADTHDSQGKDTGISAGVAKSTSSPPAVVELSYLTPKSPRKDISGDTEPNERYKSKPAAKEDSSLPRSPSPSRPWTLDESYPWEKSPESFEIRSPSSPPPTQTTPSRSSRFKFRISRPSTSTAGTQTLESFSLLSISPTAPAASSPEKKVQTPPTKRRFDLLSSIKNRMARQPVSEPSLAAVLDEGLSRSVSARRSMPPPASANGPEPDPNPNLLRVPSNVSRPVELIVTETHQLPPLRRPIDKKASRISVLSTSSSLWTASGPPRAESRASNWTASAPPYTQNKTSGWTASATSLAQNKTLGLATATPTFTQNKASGWIDLEDMSHSGWNTSAQYTSKSKDQTQPDTVPMSTFRFRMLGLKNKLKGWNGGFMTFFGSCFGRGRTQRSLGRETG